MTLENREMKEALKKSGRSYDNDDTISLNTSLVELGFRVAPKLPVPSP